jgi:hypothetical protein
MPNNTHTQAIRLFHTAAPKTNEALGVLRFQTRMFASLLAVTTYPGVVQAARLPCFI